MHIFRLLIAGAVKCILPYAVPVWATAVDDAMNRKSVRLAYWPIALMVCSFQKTILGEVVYDNAAMIL